MSNLNCGIGRQGELQSERKTGLCRRSEMQAGGGGNTMGHAVVSVHIGHLSREGNVRFIEKTCVQFGLENAPKYQTACAHVKEGPCGPQ